MVSPPLLSPLLDSMRMSSGSLGVKADVYEKDPQAGVGTVTATRRKNPAMYVFETPMSAVNKLPILRTCAGSKTALLM